MLALEVLAEESQIFLFYILYYVHGDDLFPWAAASPTVDFRKAEHTIAFFYHTCIGLHPIEAAASC